MSSAAEPECVIVEESLAEIFATTIGCEAVLNQAMAPRESVRSIAPEHA